VVKLFLDPNRDPRISRKSNDLLLVRYPIHQKFYLKKFVDNLSEVSPIQPW